ncbi:MAG: P1 family peptidase [Bryobacteraceae bacterium]
MLMLTWWHRMKGLTDIAGVLVGHASDYDGLTGCTVVICEKGAVAGGDIRGSATGVSEWDLLSPMHVTDRIHAVCFAGGSAFGLEAATGVRRYLERKGIGFKTGAGVVPLVPGAILYDLGLGKSKVRPTREMGEAAASVATHNAVVEGAVGAGTGATVGKMLGLKNAMKSGVGSWTVELGGRNTGVMVSALAVVNALGDVVDPSTGKIIAGTRRAPDSMEFAKSAQIMKNSGASGFVASNTTLVVIATNAALTKVEATKVAQLAQLGVARTVNPVNTMSDGDLCVALSVGTVKAPVDAVGVAAAEAVAEAVLRAVRLAPSLGGIPGLKK